MGPTDPEEVPRDVFERVTLEALRKPGRTVDALRAHKVVDNLRRDLDNDELSAEVAPERLRSEAPELAELADVLPKTRSDLYAALGLILSAITIYLNIDQENKPSRSVLDPAPKTLSKRDMQRRISRANTVRKWGDGQRVLLLFERGDLTKTEEWAALHSQSHAHPDAAYGIVREELHRAGG